MRFEVFEKWFLPEKRTPPAKRKGPQQGLNLVSLQMWGKGPEK
jgi:hypothetical protein